MSMLSLTRVGKNAIAKALVFLSVLSLPGIAFPNLHYIGLGDGQYAGTRLTKTRLFMPATYDDLQSLILNILQDNFTDLETKCEDRQLAEFFISLARIGSFVEKRRVDPNLECESEKLLSLYPIRLETIQGSCAEVVVCKGFVSQTKKKITKSYKYTKEFVSDHVPEIIVGGIALVALVSGAIANSNAKNSPDYRESSRTQCQNPNHYKNTHVDQEQISRPIPELKNKDFHASFQDGRTTPKTFSGIDLPNKTHAQSVEEDAVGAHSELESSLHELKDHLSNIDSRDPDEKKGIFQDSREIGAYISHQLLDMLYDSASDFNEIVDGLSQLGSHFFGHIETKENEFLERMTDDERERLFANGHDRIDRFFGTDQSVMFTPEFKENDWRRNELIEGFIPFPGEGLIKGKCLGQPRLPMTQATQVKGWKVGEPITHLTKKGNIPKWSTVKKRYWKNQAEILLKEGRALEGKIWSSTDQNLARMKKGLAPMIRNPETLEWESVELHHIPPQRDGGLFDFKEVTPWEHADMDPFRRLKKNP